MRTSKYSEEQIIGFLRLGIEVDFSLPSERVFRSLQ